MVPNTLIYTFFTYLVDHTDLQYQLIQDNSPSALLCSKKSQFQLAEKVN